jgi:hypothetical protein
MIVAMVGKSTRFYVALFAFQLSAFDFQLLLFPSRQSGVRRKWSQLSAR